MRRNPTIGVIVVAVIFATINSAGSSKDPSVETTIVRSISEAFQRYCFQNGGRWPTNWQQLETIQDFRNRSRTLFERSGVSLERSYCFLDPTILLQTDRSERIVFVRTFPIRESARDQKEIGRYAIVLGPKECVLGSEWIPEEIFQKILSANNLSLPIADLDRARAVEEQFAAEIRTDAATGVQGHFESLLISLKDIGRATFVKVGRFGVFVGLSSLIVLTAFVLRRIVRLGKAPKREK